MSFCNHEIESEIHFILSCPMYDDLRDKYIPRRYVRCPSLFKLSVLFASENKYLQLRLATFLHKAFDVRDIVLSGRACEALRCFACEALRCPKVV